MRYLRLKLGGLALALLLVGVGAWGASVRTIYLMQSAIPPTPGLSSAPTTVTLLSTIAAYEVGVMASFGGKTATGQTFRTSTTGSGVWTDRPNPPSFVDVPASGFAVASIGSSRAIFQVRNVTDSRCGVDYTDNNGSSYTQVAFGQDMDSCNGSQYSTQLRELLCVSGTCYAAGVQNDPGGACTSAPCATVMQSTNSGASWSVTLLQANAVAANQLGAASMLYSTPSAWIAFGEAAASCVPGVGPNLTRIFTSASSAAGQSVGDCYSFLDGVLFGGTYYIYGYLRNCVCPAVLFSTSSLGSAFGNIGSPTFSPSMTNPGYAVQTALACFTNYSTPTCYMAIGNSAASTFNVYTSTDMATFTRIFTVSSTGPGLNSGRFVQDPGGVIYFGTSNNYFYSIT